MAESITCAPNTPKYDYDFASTQGFGASIQDGADEPPDVITLALEIPSIKTLRNSDAVDLVEARALGEKAGYFEAFRRWQMERSEERAGGVKEALKAYSEALVKKFGGREAATRFSGIVANFRAGGPMQHVIAVASGTVAYIVTDEPLAGLGTFVVGEAVKGTSSLVLSNSWSVLRGRSPGACKATITIRFSGDVSLI